MSKWPAVTLTDVVMLQRGHDLPATARRAGEVPIIGSFGITGYHDVAKYEGPGVAIGRSGASIGVATYVQEDYWPLNTSLFVKDFKGNDPRWVYYLLDSIDFSNYNSGSAQPSLNRNYLVNIPVSLPPIGEQRAIAATLGALDDMIELNQRIMTGLKELVLTEFEKVAASAQRFLSISEGFAIGISGVWGEEAPTSPEDVAVHCLRGRDLEEYGQKTTPDAPIRYISQRQFATRQPAEGEILTAGSGTLGPTLLVTGDVLQAWTRPISYSNFVKRLVPNGRISPAIAWLAILRARRLGQFENFRTGTAMPNLDAQALLSGISVPEVSTAQLSQLEAGTRLALTSRFMRQNDRLQCVRDALSPQLLSGRIRVPEAQETMEAAA